MRLPKQMNVIPCSGKRPLVRWTEFTGRMATDEEKQDWEKTYPNSDTGIVCGPISGLFVLDIDGAEGEESIKGRDIPKTWTVKTPHGRHYYFKWTEELSTKVTTKAGVFPNVDIRGEGGFVAFYGWELPPQAVPLAHPPKWLIEALPQRGGPQGVVAVAPSTGNEGWLTEQLANIKSGARNDGFTRVAGLLRAKGMSSQDIFVLLEPKAKEVNFPQWELRTLCNSVGRYPTSASAIVPDDEETDTSLRAFMKVIVPPVYIVEGMIAKKKIGVFAGLPETGKTWALMDLAIECARGDGMWLGKFPVNGRQKVFFIDQERDKSETQRRFGALLAGKGITIDDLEGFLDVRCEGTTKIDLQHSFDAFRRKLDALKPDLVIVDSLATFHTKEESNRTEIQSVMERVKQMRNEYGCSFMFVHHETKQAFQNRKEGGEPSYLDAAGNVAIPAACETFFNMKREDVETSMAYHTKSTIGRKVAPFLVRVTDLDETKTRIRVEAV
jgi:KaiC/GvpD/RAD55 family RecA-like ATPase